MKIGLFTDSFYPEVNGVATSCLNLERELTRRGHEVHVYAPRCKNWQDYQRANIHYIPSLPLALLRDRNVAIPGYAIATEAVAMKFDVIHTHSEFLVGQMGCYVAKATGCVRIHTYHTIWEDYTHYVTRGIADETAKKIVRKYSEWWCERFDRVVVPTNKTKNLLLKYHIDAPIDVIPSGMDLARFAPHLHTPQEIAETRKECGVGEGQRVLLYIGRIAKEKNLEQVLRVFPAVHSKLPDVHLVIVGEGPVREKLQKMAEDAGVGEWVSLVGSKPWECIDRYYAIGDVFVSMSHSETQGLTYIEAMAAGLCVCAADDPCLEGVIHSGENGILTGDSDEELLESLLLAFSPKGEELARCAPEYAAAFSTQQFAASVESCYETARREHFALTVE